MRSHRGLAWLAFAGASLVAVALGAWVAAAHGAPPRAWGLNLAAWAVSGLLAAGLSRVWPSRAAWWPVLVPLALGATLLSPGLDGVHRWVTLGPVRLNVAELLLPSVVVSLAGQRHPLVALLCTAALLAILALQPDISQSAALAGAAVVMILTAEASLAVRTGSAMAVVILAALALVRPDPLAPVPEVEGILQLAWAQAPLLATLAAAALAATALAPLLAGRHAPPLARGASTALAIYLLLCAAAPFVGAYPVPLVGMGVSPILGAWLGFGALMGLLRAEERAA